jgi:hypothetical protein
MSKTGLALGVGELGECPGGRAERAGGGGGNRVWYFAKHN